MKKKMIISMSASATVYVLLMMCIGVFGTSLQTIMIPICLQILKWIAVVVGFILAVFLPVRIINALSRNDARRMLAELEAEANKKKEEENQEALRKHAVEEAILKAYYKEEDDV